MEVRVPGMPSVIYGNVDGDTAKKIVTDHIGRKVLVSEHIFDKPSADIVDGTK